MRTNRIKRFAGILLALTVTAASTFSANYSQSKGRNQSNKASCLNQISGLSQDQKNQIMTMESTHQATMNELRDKRQATTDNSQKAQIRHEMDTEVSTHRNAVRALLNADQQKQFDQIARNGGTQQNCGKQGKGRQGSGTWNGSGSGRRGR